MVRIVHFSDWHWDFVGRGGLERGDVIPEADLYVCTGDMYSNYPDRSYDAAANFNWRIVPAVETRKQLAAANRFGLDGGFRRYLGSPDAPLVCVRGNHDFIGLSSMFIGCNLVWEFKDNELIEVCGLTVTGHRGIPYIYGGWSDEVARPDLLDRFKRMPDADLVLTHYPPKDMLDADWPGRTPGYGLEGVLNNLSYRAKLPKLHCFGHIHGAGRRVEDNGIRFSNAACGVNVIEL